MKIKGKLLSFLLCTAMTVSMAGCGNTDESEKKTTASKTEETTTTTTAPQSVTSATTVATTTTAVDTTDAVISTTEPEAETTTTTLSETETTTTPKKTTVTTTKAPVTTKKTTTTKKATTTKKTTTTKVTTTVKAEIDSPSCTDEFDNIFGKTIEEIEKMLETVPEFNKDNCRKDSGPDTTNTYYYLTYNYDYYDNQDYFIFCDLPFDDVTFSASNSDKKCNGIQFYLRNPWRSSYYCEFESREDISDHMLSTIISHYGNYDEITENEFNENPYYVWHISEDIKMEYTHWDYSSFDLFYITFYKE